MPDTTYEEAWGDEQAAKGADVEVKFKETKPAEISVADYCTQSRHKHSNRGTARSPHFRKR